MQNFDQSIQGLAQSASGTTKDAICRISARWMNVNLYDPTLKLQDANPSIGN
jgi:hypothetical protein